MTHPRLDLANPVHRWLLGISLLFSALVLLFVAWLHRQERKRPIAKPSAQGGGSRRRRKRKS